MIVSWDHWGIPSSTAFCLLSLLKKKSTIVNWAASYYLQEKIIKPNQLSFTNLSDTFLRSIYQKG